MKKLDKLILQSFFAPFILTFLVAVFILLLQYMLKYFDDFVGKNLGIGVFAELMLYFSVNMMPMALPLAVLVSSLMTFGNLGQHFELTAIKSAGISLIRILLPIFCFVILLSIGAFYFNNHVVPAANLKAYSLLYDIKQTKASLDLKQGQFYDGLPGYSIRVRKKYPDGKTMKDVLIYDHTGSKGNMKVISADSCLMYTMINDRYLMMELYEGNYYIEENPKKSKKKKKKKKDDKSSTPDVKINRFIKTKFDKMDLVFSLSSFDLDRSNVDLFAGNRYMKSIYQLTESIDSMTSERNSLQFQLISSLAGTYRYHMGGFIPPSESFVENYDPLNHKKKGFFEKLFAKEGLEEDVPDSLHQVDEKDPSMDQSVTTPNIDIKNKRKIEPRRPLSDVLDYIESKSQAKAKKDTSFLVNVISEKVANELAGETDNKKKLKVAKSATSTARKVKTNIGSTINRYDRFRKSIDSHVVEKYKKYAQAFSCIVMFLIGAPLGAIIKRGGMGFPVVISVIFFVKFYVITSVTDKWAKAGKLDGMVAAWLANLVLIPFGLYFLKQARKDARLFEADVYNIWFEKYVKFIVDGGLSGWLVKKGIKKDWF